MRVVTWNCNGALRNKLQPIEELEADLYVIQECEDPERTRNKAYAEWACNYIWKGPTKNKGIGIFAREGITLEPLSWASGLLELFLPCRVNNQFNLLGVWTRQANSPTFRYIGQFWKYLQEHWLLIRQEPILIAGDFNSNTRWDEWDRWWNHSDVVNQLSSLGVTSVYHQVHNEEQGRETTPTFFHQRKVEKPYHIDYMFASTSILRKVSRFEIGAVEKWLSTSDHMPLITEFDL